LGPGGVLVGVRCTLHKMGGQAFAVNSGEMLTRIGKLVEVTEGVTLDRVPVMGMT